MTAPYVRTEYTGATYPVPPLHPLEETRRARAIELLDTYLPGTRQMVRQALAANLVAAETGDPVKALFDCHPGVEGPITAEYLICAGLIPGTDQETTRTEVLSEMWRLVRQTILVFLERPRSVIPMTPEPEPARPPAKPTADPEYLDETRHHRALWILDNMTVPLPVHEAYRNGAGRTVRRALAFNALAVEQRTPGEIRAVFATATDPGNITDVDLIEAGMLPGYNGALTDTEVIAEMRRLVQEVVVTLSRTPDPAPARLAPAQALDPVRAHAATAAAHACAPMYAALPDVDATGQSTTVKLTAQALAYTAKVLEGYLRGETP